jgi:subtilisin family serine protease
MMAIPRVFVRLRSVCLVLFTVLAVAPAFAQDVPVSTQAPKARAGSAVYIVQMIDPPVVANTGQVPGFSATAPARGQKINPANPDVVRYVGYLDARHSEVAARVAVNKLYDYRYAFNGFAAALTREQVEAVRTAPGVIAVEETRQLPMDTATTPAFLGLKEAGTGLWARGIKGENIIIGILDSGIWPESASFSDRTGAGPNGQPGRLSYHQIPSWHGKCASEEETDGSFDANLCNQKLIGAQYFCVSKGCDDVLPHEFLSPRDFNGHGTHTASTAGGNEGVIPTGAAALFGTVNGIAPRARIAAYKICWDDGEGRCFADSGDAVAAIDQAVADGVDVLNYSIAGTSTNYLDSVEVAFLFAARAGVFVATSAGNSGPTASTVAHISPWLASVAAGTHSRSGSAKVKLGNGAEYTGASLTPGVGPASIVLATASGVAGADPNLVRQCFSTDADGNPVLDSAKVAGKIVVCERGGTAPANARVDKSLAVKNAGGVGAVIYNVSASSLNADLHSLPTVHVDHVAGPLIVAYVNSAGASATATLTQAVVTQTGPAPDVAAFSSRGPSRAGVGDVLKPDFMAPGVDILAAVAPPGNAGKDFDIFSGTSMSSPHVAGIGALLSQAHPSWSPAAKRSAIATTADAVSRAGLNQPFATGSGHVRPNLAENPGIVYDVDYNGYLAFLKGQGLCCAGIATLQAIDASDLNQPSLAVGDLPGVQTLTRTVTNVTSLPATYSATIQPPTGYSVAVNPTTLELAAGGSASFTVTITRTDGPLNTYRFGALTWSDGLHTARSPIVVRPVAVVAPAEVTGTGSTGALSYSIKTGYAGSLSYAKRGLIASTPFSGTVADDPNDNFDTATPADNEGITTHDLVVPAGTSVLRVSMFDPDTDGADDIDLYLYRVNADSTLTLVGVSGSGTSAEQIQLANPTAATYRLFVHGWETDGADANYTLHVWTLGTADAGNMTVTGPSTATIGGAGTVDLSWSGLDAGLRYLGAILYQDGATTHGTTIVRIDN